MSATDDDTPAAASAEAEAAWHRKVAIERFNRTWDLIDQGDRSAYEDDELLEAALTSRYHWGIVGGASQWAVGDGQISRVAATLGLSDMAVRYARRSLAIVEDEGWTDFHLVSAFEVLGRAHAAAGSATERAAAIGRARAALEHLDDPEDIELLTEQIESVPDAVT